MALQHFFTEASTNLADGLVGFGFRVITRQEEGAIYVSAFSLPVIPPDNDEVQRVTNPSEVILLNLFIGVSDNHLVMRCHTFNQFTLLLLGS